MFYKNERMGFGKIDNISEKEHHQEKVLGDFEMINNDLGGLFEDICSIEHVASLDKDQLLSVISYLRYTYLDGVHGREKFTKLDNLPWYDTFIQAANDFVGISISKLDGLAGSQTKRDIRNFQSKSNIPVDGIPGDQYLQALEEVLCDTVPGEYPWMDSYDELQSTEYGALYTPYDAHIKKYGDIIGVPRNLFLKLCMKESGVAGYTYKDTPEMLPLVSGKVPMITYKRNSRGEIVTDASGNKIKIPLTSEQKRVRGEKYINQYKEKAESYTGSFGVTQILLKTRNDIIAKMVPTYPEIQISERDRTNPEHQIILGMMYLKEQKKRYKATRGEAIVLYHTGSRIKSDSQAQYYASVNPAIVTFYNKHVSSSEKVTKDSITASQYMKGAELFYTN